MATGLKWPISPSTYRITQGFAGDYVAEAPGYLDSDARGPKRAKRSRFNGGEYRTDLHAAIDQACPIGTPIGAPEAGKIVGAGVYSSTGEKYLMLRIHRDSTRQVIVFLTHLSKTVVPVGARVARGQRIALSGNSGRSTGPHLHWEVRVGPASADASTSGKWFKWNPRRLVSGSDLAGLPWLKPS